MGVVVEDSHKPPDSSYWSQVSGLFESQPSAGSTRGSLLHACSSFSSSLAVAVMGMAGVQPSPYTLQLFTLCREPWSGKVCKNILKVNYVFLHPP